MESTYIAISLVLLTAAVGGIFELYNFRRCAAFAMTVVLANFTYLAWPEQPKPVYAWPTERGYHASPWVFPSVAAAERGGWSEEQRVASRRDEKAAAESNRHP